MNRARREQQKRLGIKHPRVYQFLDLSLRLAEEGPPRPNVWFAWDLSGPARREAIEQERRRLANQHRARLNRGLKKIARRLTDDEHLELMALNWLP